MPARPHVLIVGAGIGGLTAGLSLLRRGFDVDIFERAAELGEVGAGLHVTPNGARVLAALGLGAAVAAVAARPQLRIMRLWDSGEGWELPGQDLGAEERYGAPYLLLHRADLHAILVAAVLALKPAAIHLSSVATGFSQTADGVVLRLADGACVAGDALVGADGVKSVLREQLFGPDRPRFTGSIYWRGLVPIALVPPDSRRAAAGWVGPRNFVTVYPVRRGELLNMNATALRDDWQVESWTERGTQAECLADFAGWHDDVQQIIRNIPAPYKWGSFLRDPLQQWSVGRVTLLGDACHSMLASLGQGGNMALEDGFVLASCLDRYAGDVGLALERYQAARVARATRIVELSNAQSARRLRPELADPVEARKTMESLWSKASVSELYDWIFEYDATSIPV